MGRDKLYLEVDGLPLIRRVHDPLAAACQEVLVVGSGGPRLEGVRQVAGERPGGQGPLAGIEAGLTAASHAFAFVAAGDMPFVPQGLVAHLLQRLQAGSILAVVPEYRGRAHPLCAAYARTVLPRVSAALDGGMRAVCAFLEELGEVAYAGEELCRFGDPDLLLMNVNSPEDLERARRAVEC